MPRCYLLKKKAAALQLKGQSPEGAEYIVEEPPSPPSADDADEVQPEAPHSKYRNVS